jgi:signal transduction histidine kinase
VSVTKTPGRRLPGWALTEGPFGVRMLDVGIVALVIVAVELNVVVGGGPGASPLNFTAYLLGGLLPLPILFRHRWPFHSLVATSLLVLLYYLVDRRNISPAPALAVPLYDAALDGYLAWAITIPAVFMGIGLIVVELSTKEGLVTLTTDFLPQIVLLALAIMLGEVVRSRRALAEETARRLRLAQEERAAETARLMAEERLRIARELHDTVAHSMATITVQAGSALHLLSPLPPGAAPAAPDATALRSALSAIRDTSKGALSEMRSVLGQLRGSGGAPAPDAGTGLDRLPALRDAVSAAGTKVTVNVEGDPVALPAEADHAAYRILQESLTNVLRHAGPGAVAAVCLRYQPGSLAVSVTDDGTSVAAASGGPDGGGPDGGGPDWGGPDWGGGHGISGMRERAAAAGGTLTAGRRPEGGFEVSAVLPISASSEESA